MSTKSQAGAVDPAGLSKSGKGLVSKPLRNAVQPKGRDDSREGFVGMKGIDESASESNLLSTKSLPKPDITMTITVKSARNIKGNKGDKVNSFVRVQFADFDYKDSPVVNDTGSPAYGFSLEQVYTMDETLIDLFANGRVTITLFESLPKDKTQSLGVAEISLYDPFIKSLKEKSPVLSAIKTAPIVYSNTKLLVNDIVPEIEVEISLSSSLLSEIDLENGTFAQFKLVDVAPVPEEWSLKDGTEKDPNSNMYTYNVDFYVPTENQSQRKISVNNGLLTGTEGPSQSLMNISILEGEDLGAIEKKGADSLPASTDPRKVFWGYTHHIFLSGTTLKKLKEKAQRKETLDLEFYRSMHPKFSAVNDVHAHKYRGLARVDITAILVPGTTGLQGRFLLDSPDSVPNEGTGRDALNTAGSERSKKEIKPDSSSPYRAASSSLAFKFLMEKPLIPKTTIKLIEKSVNDFIPKRSLPQHLIQEKRHIKADEDYRVEVQTIVAKLIEEYRSVMTADVGGVDSEFNSLAELSSSSATEEQHKKKKFLFHLNRSGAYFTFKEKLKSAVVQVVRENFNRKSAFSSKDEQQLFLSEVYVYLTDQMHIAINKMFTDKDRAFVDPTLSKTADFEALKEFADAAEYDFQIKTAAEYHRERVAKYEDKIHAWYDYACFCLRNGESAKGEECLREILSRNAKHVPSLLSYGALCISNEKFDEWLVYHKAILEVDPKNIVAHVLMALYYDILENEYETEQCVETANRLQKEGANPTESIYILAAKFLINMHASQLAEAALSREFISHGRRADPHLLLTTLEIQKRQFDMAAYHIKEAIEVRRDDPIVWSAKGHLNYVQRQWDESRLAYENVLSLTQDPTPLFIVYLRLGSIYLRQGLQSDRDGNQIVDTKLMKIAKSVFLRACDIKPCSESWLGAGRACFALGELDEAEDAYAEANVLNNRNSEVWAHLAILNLSKNRTFEANQSLAQCLRLGIREKDLLHTLGVSFLKSQLNVQAVECFRFYLEMEPDSVRVRDLLSKALREDSAQHVGNAYTPGKLNGVREALVK